MNGSIPVRIWTRQGPKVLQAVTISPLSRKFVDQSFDVVGRHGFVVFRRGHAASVRVEIVRAFCRLATAAIDVEQHRHDRAGVVPPGFVRLQQTALET